MISFGDNVHVASGVKFINHDVSVLMLRHMNPEAEYQPRQGDITIGDNVFIGSNSILLYGVHVGNNVIIGAGSIVTKDLDDGVVAAGVPCRPISSFEAFENKMRKETTP